MRKERVNKNITGISDINKNFKNKKFIKFIKIQLTTKYF